MEQQEELFKDIEIWNDLYQRRGIIKALNTKNAFYYVFYSFKYNVMYFMETNGYLHNIHFRRYVRRDEKKSDYAYLFRPDFNNHFIKYDSHDARMLSVVEMEVKSLGYIPHEEMLKQCNNQDVIDRCKYMEYDFEFSESEFRDFNKSLVKDIKEIIEDYHNIVLVDYQYFCDAVEEKINQYKEFRTFTIDNINLKAIVDQFMKQMVGDSFEKYVFYAIKPFNYKKNISGDDIDKYFKKYNNFKILDTENYENDFLGVVFQIMKNYYINEKFFHIDKYIIIADNIKVRELLDIITPKFNFGSENPDILLVRNLNGLTEMNGLLRYMVIDYVVAAILGLTIEEFGQLEALSYDI
ncbi:hypothetical protein [Clostridium ihumii]|uniref:hypothetical protein n=1 Tax=Clostridium ihumii TaxID=1470356 RepID=UPI0005905A83|nr:hypothetical protein [Clostridium ihumii]